MKYRIALGIEYDGTRFNGTQTQRGQRTVQQELERAVSQVASAEVQLKLSSRTDSGVHATNQVVAFHSDAFRNEDSWQKGINTYVSDDLMVHTVIPVANGFDARRSSRWRRYVYIFGECDHIPAIGRNFVTWVAPGLDVEAMDLQAQALLGEHDFTSFRATSCQSKSPRRCIHALTVLRAGNYVIIDIIANAFLLRMVRNIAGALLEIGRGNSLNLNSLLSFRDRTRAPKTAPPMGLYLVQICYEEYPELSRLRIPRILGSEFQLIEWESDDFVNVREHIEQCESITE